MLRGQYRSTKVPLQRWRRWAENRCKEQVQEEPMKTMVEPSQSPTASSPAGAPADRGPYQCGRAKTTSDLIRPLQTTAAVASSGELKNT
jgi:hypothetical protein